MCIKKKYTHSEICKKQMFCEKKEQRNHCFWLKSKIIPELELLIVFRVL